MFSSPPGSLQQQENHQRTVARLFVYVLFGCSAILLYRSCRLESFRFQTLIQNKVSTTRSLPAKDEIMVGGPVGNKWPTEFYVPSLDFRIKGKSQYSSSIPNVSDFEAHIYCEEFQKELSWDWWGPNQKEHRRLRATARKRLLIGLSSGYDSNAKLLEQAVWNARMYAETWAKRGVDVTVVTLQGAAFAPHGCKAPKAHSSIDKIRILFEAIDSQPSYDRLLLLDYDAMVFDMDQDMFSILEGDDSFVVAGPILLNEEGKKDKFLPWRIGSGMTLWNLKHSATSDVALDWFHYAKNAIIKGTYQYDQKYLHKALQRHYATNANGMVARNSDREGIVIAMEDKEFGNESEGKFVQQFGDSSQNKQSRLDRMKAAAQQVCGQASEVCGRVGGQPHYESS